MCHSQGLCTLNRFVKDRQLPSVEIDDLLINVIETNIFHLVD